MSNRDRISKKRPGFAVIVSYILVIALTAVVTLFVAQYFGKWTGGPAQAGNTQNGEVAAIETPDKAASSKTGKNGLASGSRDGSAQAGGNSSAKAGVDGSPKSESDIAFSDNWYMNTRTKFVLDGVWHRMGSIEEILGTVKNVRHTSELSWFREWNKTAEKLKATGDNSLAKGHKISAGEAYLRASNYYFAAEVFLHTNPEDPRILETYKKGADCFLKGLKLLSVPVEEVSIPFEGTKLKGYYFRSPVAKEKAPVIIVHQGFDAPLEATKYVAEEAMRRGYHCLMFEGPGQGMTIREQGIPFRPDWEKPVSAAVDYVISRPEVDPDKIILEGISLGGGLAVRSAEFEPRIKICIANPGYVNLYKVFSDILTPTLVNLYEEDPKEFSDKFLELTRYDVGLRWGANHAMWVFGGKDPVELFDKLRQYDYEADLGRIKAKMLVMDGTGEKWGAGQAKKLYDALKCPKEYMLFTEEDFAEEHCQSGNPALSTQRMFDWLDENIN
jgi:alpha-beta hydrolase superfamily lysophospholipase